jgi:hypothetical protein
MSGEVMSPRSTFADNLAVVALLLAAIAAAAGLLVSGLYRDTAEMVRQARAADLVTLAAAVPALGLGLWRARSGSASARLVAIGALGYLAYSYAIYAFSVVINPLTPVHIAILGLAAWSFVLVIFGLDRATLDRASRIRLPRRTAGGFLIIVAALFALLWLGQIAGAITGGKLPASVSDLNLPTNAVYALDLAFALPLLAIAGGWLIRHDRRGPATALAALSFIVLMGLSVLAIFAIDATAGVSVDAVPVVIFGVVTGVAAVLAVLGITSTRLGIPAGSLLEGHA